MIDSATNFEQSNESECCEHSLVRPSILSTKVMQHATTSGQSSLSMTPLLDSQSFKVKAVYNKVCLIPKEKVIKRYLQMINQDSPWRIDGYHGHDVGPTISCKTCDNLPAPIALNSALFKAHQSRPLIERQIVENIYSQAQMGLPNDMTNGRNQVPSFNFFNRCLVIRDTSSSLEPTEPSLIKGSIHFNIEPLTGKCNIDTLAVAPDARGKGLGSRLLLAAMVIGLANGCQKFSLESYEESIQFYLKHGFYLKPSFDKANKALQYCTDVETIKKHHFYMTFQTTAPKAFMDRLLSKLQSIGVQLKPVAILNQYLAVKQAATRPAKITESLVNMAEPPHTTTASQSTPYKKSIKPNRTGKLRL